jgi:hypothetical protein
MHPRCRPSGLCTKRRSAESIGPDRRAASSAPELDSFHVYPARFAAARFAGLSIPKTPSELKMQAFDLFVRSSSFPR